MIKKSEPTTYKAPSYNNLYAYPIKTIEIIKIIKINQPFFILTFSFLRFAYNSAPLEKTNVNLVISASNNFAVKIDNN